MFLLYFLMYSKDRNSFNMFLEKNINEKIDEELGW